MKTVTGKEFRKLLNSRQKGLYLSEFKYLRECDPLFPECAGKELKPGYKVKVDVWHLDDAQIYSDFIFKKEAMHKSLIMTEINRIWYEVYPAYIYGIEERIKVRTKRIKSFENEAPHEKQYKLRIKLDKLKELERQIDVISREFESAQDSMHYIYMIFDIEHEIRECEFFIHEASEAVKSVIQCIDYLDKNKKSSSDGSYSNCYKSLGDDKNNLFHLKESCARGVVYEKNTRKENELLYYSLNELHQLLVSKKQKVESSTL